MPIRPHLRHHYGQEWRTVIRPAALIAACYECERCGLPDRPMGLKSALECAHLDGNPANIAPTNIAILCHRHHKAADYPLWASRCRETRIERKDAARGLLQLMQG